MQAKSSLFLCNQTICIVYIFTISDFKKMDSNDEIHSQEVHELNPISAIKDSYENNSSHDNMKETDEKVELNEENETKESPEKVRKHKCDTCEKAFTRLDHLKRHVACVHEGQRNYNCGFCEKAFTRPDRLKHHIASAHNEHYEDSENINESNNSYYQSEYDNNSFTNKSFKHNPWDVGQLEDFLYFCCPECDLTRDTIYQSKELFLQHAMDEHPMAKESLTMLEMKSEPYEDDYIQGE